MFSGSENQPGFFDEFLAMGMIKACWLAGCKSCWLPFCKKTSKVFPFFSPIHLGLLWGFRVSQSWLTKAQQKAHCNHILKTQFQLSFVPSNRPRSVFEPIKWFSTVMCSFHSQIKKNSKSLTVLDLLKIVFYLFSGKSEIYRGSVSFEGSSGADPGRISGWDAFGGSMMFHGMDDPPVVP